MAQQINPYSAALARFLDSSGMTQQTLADTCDCTQAAISRYVNGRLPPRDIAVKIEAATDQAIPLWLWGNAIAQKVGLVVNGQDAA